MSDTSFKDALVDLVDEWKNATADGKVTLHEQLQLAAEGCQTLEALLHGITNDDEFEQLVKDAEQVVQQYVVPLDLSKFKVPPFVERFVIDPQLVPMVRPVLEAVRSSLVKSATTDSDDDTQVLPPVKPGKPGIGQV